MCLYLGRFEYKLYEAQEDILEVVLLFEREAVKRNFSYVAFAILVNESSRAIWSYNIKNINVEIQSELIRVIYLHDQAKNTKF